MLLLLIIGETVVHFLLQPWRNISMQTLIKAYLSFAVEYAGVCLCNLLLQLWPPWIKLPVAHFTPE